ncbi:MAG: hypothetical protein ACTSUB_08010 [Candidatus Thorarchaeota archaeon]
MSENNGAMEFYHEQLAETKTLSRRQLLLGFFFSTIFGAVTTFGLLYFVSAISRFHAEVPTLIVYTYDFLLGLVVATIFAGIICFLILRYPSSTLLLMKVHRFLKRGSGEYFVCPEDSDQSMNQVARRSLYGSLLVAGFALFILSFELMGDTPENQILELGALVMLASVIVLPFTMVLFYYSPWIIKDSGLFHLDVKDRSLSNVGDNLEDVLEFVAGIDIILVWIELTLATEWWIAPFIFMVLLGPLFSIVMNFTLVFMTIKKKATENAIQLLLEKHDYPDMVRSNEYIRWRVLALVDRRMLAEQFVEVYDSKQEAKTADLGDSLESEMTAAPSTASEEMKAIDEKIESEIRGEEFPNDELDEAIETIEPGEEIVIFDSESDSDSTEE